MSQIEYALQAKGSFEFLRELHLRDFVSKTSCLEDIIKLFTKKLTLVNSNQNATITLLEEFVWALLTSLWDSEFLVPKVEILNRLRSSNSSEKVTAAQMEAKLSSKTKELGNAMVTIGVLETRLDELAIILAQERQNRPTLDQGNQTDSHSADCNSVSNQTECVNLLSAESFGFDISSMETETYGTQLPNTARFPPFQGESFGFDISPMETETYGTQQPNTARYLPFQGESFGFDISPMETETYGTQQPNTARDLPFEGLETVTEHEGNIGPNQFSACSSKQDDATYGADRDYPGTADEPETWEVTPEPAYGNTDPAERQRLSGNDIAEIRINQLLQEIAEKDEIINVVSEELHRVSARVRDFGTSPRRSTAPGSRRLTPVDLTIPGIVSESVSSALDETQVEIALLKTECECLRMTICEFEAENVRLSSRLDMMKAAAPDIQYNCVEELVQTEIINIALTTRKHGSIAIEGDLSEEMLLRRELAEERIKSQNALDETERVKMCIDELETQLASMEFQLRRAGVKHEHIHKAMMKSGLTNLLRGSRAVVFERLYQDAMDRIKRMERIREKVWEIQKRQFNKKFPASTMSQEISTLPGDIPHSMDIKSSNKEHHMLRVGLASRIHPITHAFPRARSLDLKRVLKILPYRLLI